MVRIYKRKTEKKDDLLYVNALHAIDYGMAVRAAARQFGVPLTTLRRHVRNNQISSELTQDDGTSANNEDGNALPTKKYIIKTHGGTGVKIYNSPTEIPDSNTLPYIDDLQQRSHTVTPKKKPKFSTSRQQLHQAVAQTATESSPHNFYSSSKHHLQKIQQQTVGSPILGSSAQNYFSSSPKYLLQQTVASPVLEASTQNFFPSSKHHHHHHLSQTQPTVATSLLETSAQNIQHDEFDTFGQHVANQLRTLPLTNAILCQNFISNYLSQERLKVLSSQRTGTSEPISLDNEYKCDTSTAAVKTEEIYFDGGLSMQEQEESI